MELENYLKGKTIESVKETEKGLEIVFKEEKFVPEDGDFCLSAGGCLCIFHKNGNIQPIVYAGLYKDSMNKGRLAYNTEGFTSHMLRLLTESEKQTLLDALTKDGKRWNAEKKQIEEIRWRAENGECYKFVSSYGKILFNQEGRFPWDDDNYNIGNYFRINEDVSVYIEKMKSIFSENL